MVSRHRPSAPPKQTLTDVLRIEAEKTGAAIATSYRAVEDKMDRQQAVLDGGLRELTLAVQKSGVDVRVLEAGVRQNTADIRILEAGTRQRAADTRALEAAVREVTIELREFGRKLEVLGRVEQRIAALEGRPAPP